VTKTLEKALAKMSRLPAREQYSVPMFMRHVVAVWRIVFRWEGGDAVDVRVADYQ
jgi:plasmid maintenance system killer protein